MAGAVGVQAPSWEDQIVPTLKKRLESESQYLSNRLSSSGFHEYEVNEIPPSPHSNYGGSGSVPASQPIRNRTKSTPFFDGPSNSSVPYGVRDGNQAGPSRIPIPSRPAQNTTQRSYNDTYDSLSHSQSTSSRIPRLQPASSGMRRPSGSSMSSSSSGPDSVSPTVQPNRTLTRPRSKTTLAPRPHIERSSSGSFQDRAYPSGLPIPTNRKSSRQRSTSISPGKGQHDRGGYGENRYETDREEGSREVLAHRESFDLSKQVFQDTTNLRDELPPFRLAADEAMRIATHGHHLLLEEDDVVEQGDRVEDEGTAKRKRVESMFPTKEGARRAEGTSGMSRSTTGSALGIGTPSSRGSKIGSSAQQRSATGSGISASRSPLSSSQNSTTRSMSLGHSLNARSTSPVPTPPRMGVAAHFVPIESAYTPPKGANWDDVVLPALARKMGLGQGGEKIVGSEEKEEGDLAVEWDRNGTPVKWVKARPTLGEAGNGPLNLNTTVASGRSIRGEGWSADEERIFHSSPRSASAFSPTFEPSPDNPLHYSTSSTHQKDTSMISESTPTPSPMRPHPLQSTRNQSSHSDAYDAMYDIDPPSPAPFSSLAVRPTTGPLALRPSGSTESTAGIPNLGDRTTSGGVTRKQSFLRRKPSVVSRQASGTDLRVKRSDSSLRQAGLERPVVQPAQNQKQAVGNQGLSRPSDVVWERQMAGGPTRAGAVPTNWAQAGEGGAKGALGQPPTSEQQAKVKGRVDQGDHGKGCGCVIM